MKARNGAIVTAIIALMFAFILGSPAFSVDEPYGAAHQGDLKVVLPNGGDTTGGESSSQQALSPGIKITISGSGFAPRAKYDILWDGKVVVDPYADDNGFASYEFSIPSSAATGIHTVSMQGAAASGGTLTLSSNVSVKANNATKQVNKEVKEVTSLPFTGGGWLLYILIGGMLLVFAGFGMRLARKGR